MHLSIYHVINIPKKTTNAIVNDVPDYNRQKITKKLMIPLHTWFLKAYVVIHYPQDMFWRGYEISKIVIGCSDSRIVWARVKK